MSNKLKPSKASRFILFIGVGLMTLMSYPIYVWAVGLAFIGLFMVIEKIPLKKRPFGESLFFLLLLSIAAIRFQVFLRLKVPPIYLNAFTGNTARYILCILTWFTVRSIALSRKRDTLKNLLAPLLTFHVGVFFVQFFTYLFTHHYIDLLETFTGEASRYKGFMSSFGIIRPTGMMAEPSTYFAVILSLTILSLLKEGFSKHKRLFVLTIISMYLSFSTAALIIATLFIFYIFYTEKVSWRFYFLSIIGVIPLLFLSNLNLNQIYEAQFSKTTGRGGDIRLALTKAVANRDMDNALTAFGVYANDKNITEMTAGGGAGSRIMSSISDAGVFVYIWAVLGFLGIAYFIILCAWQYKISKKHFWLFLILSLTKVKLFGPLFIFYFAYSITQKKAKKSDINYLSDHDKLPIHY